MEQDYDVDLEAARMFLQRLPLELAQDLDRAALLDSGQPFERLARGCLASAREARALNSSASWRPIHWQDREPETLALRLAITVLEQRKPFKADTIRVDRGEYERASHMCVCTTCGCKYIEHPHVPGYSWLTRVCNGSLVKL